MAPYAHINMFGRKCGKALGRGDLSVILTDHAGIKLEFVKIFDQFKVNVIKDERRNKTSLSTQARLTPPPKAGLFHPGKSAQLKQLIRLYEKLEHTANNGRWLAAAEITDQETKLLNKVLSFPHKDQLEIWNALHATDLRMFRSASYKSWVRANTAGFFGFETDHQIWTEDDLATPIELEPQTSLAETPPSTTIDVVQVPEPPTMAGNPENIVSNQIDKLDTRPLPVLNTHSLPLNSVSFSLASRSAGQSGFIVPHCINILKKNGYLSGDLDDENSFKDFEIIDFSTPRFNFVGMGMVSVSFDNTKTQQRDKSQRKKFVLNAMVQFDEPPHHPIIQARLERLVHATASPNAGGTLVEFYFTWHGTDPELIQRADAIALDAFEDFDRIGGPM